MNKLKDIAFSILDLATIVEGDINANEAFKRSVLYAQQAEPLDYKRYWFAEHHNMESVASAATSVLIGHIAQATSKIRVGSGGIMLPNHAPLIIAEQFGTLATLYPNRIDLGIGRAPGTDQLTSWALRRNLKADVDEFPNDVVELITYLGPRTNAAKIRAIPGEGTNVPVWLLGSSTYSAQLAGMLGLPFAFAAHFAPAQLMQAIQVYRKHFKPSLHLQQPYVMVCINVIIADTNEVATHLATSLQQMALGFFRNDRKPLPPPVDSMESIWTEQEKLGVQQMQTYSFVGDSNTVGDELKKFIETTAVDEIMFSTHVFDTTAKLHSMKLTAELFSS
jgi:luciferase family oxidoreductase group 1